MANRIDDSCSGGAHNWVASPHGGSDCTRCGAATVLGPN